MLNVFYSDQTHLGLTHFNADKTKEYYLDSIIKPSWLYKQAKDDEGLNFYTPENYIKDIDVLKIHSKKYIEALKTGSPKDLAESSGMRWVKNLYVANLTSVNAFYSSCLSAYETGKISCCFSTNFHHAKKGKGSGFCVLNGVAITAHSLLTKTKLKKILILDCDFHYGDGNAEILKNLDSVEVVDIYGGLHKTASNVTSTKNITTIEATNSDQYFEALERFTDKLDRFKPDIILFDAGVDVWENDRYGGIKGMTAEKIASRDRLVFTECKKRGIPISFMIGGGYVKYKDKNGDPLSNEGMNNGKRELIKLHYQTIKEAINTAPFELV